MILKVQRPHVDDLDLEGRTVANPRGNAAARLNADTARYSDSSDSESGEAGSPPAGGSTVEPAADQSQVLMS